MALVHLSASCARKRLPSEANLLERASRCLRKLVKWRSQYKICRSSSVRSLRAFGFLLRLRPGSRRHQMAKREKEKKKETSLCCPELGCLATYIGYVPHVSVCLCLEYHNVASLTARLHAWLVRNVP